VRDVYLYGHLAEEFGDKFRLEVGSFREAVRLLEVNFPGRFRDAISRGFYRLVVGDTPEDGEDFGEDMVSFMKKTGDFHIVPVPEGAGRGKSAIKIVVGVAVAVAAFEFAGPVIAGQEATTGLAAQAGLGFTFGQVALAGAAVALGGVTQLLTPTPQVSNAEIDDNKKSFLFNGITNTTVEGGIVPVVYGQMRVGSIVVSSGVQIEDLVPQRQFGTPFGGIDVGF